MSHEEVAAESQHTDIEGLFFWNGDVSLEGNRTITRVRVDDTITVIPTHAFFECVKLREVQLPIGLTRLEDSCFRECLVLERIIIPDSVQEIGNSAFEDSGIQGEVKIPPGVTEIEYCVFKGCTSLVKVELHENVTRIGELCFCFCHSLTSIELPPSLREIRHTAFFASGLEEICLPSNVSIGESAFANCHELKTIIFPECMGIIETRVFFGCQNICALHLPITKPETKFTATEQKLITELSRLDGRSSIDRIGMGWNIHGKILNNTVQTTCLFTILKQNAFRI